MSRLPPRPVLAGLAAIALAAVYAYFSARGAHSELRQAASYRAAPLAEQIRRRVDPGEPLTAEILARTPPTARILLDDVDEVLQPLFVERTVAYWVHPRRVYSAKVFTDLGLDRARAIRERGIDWIYDASGLRWIGESAPPPAPTSGGLGERFRGDRLRGIGGVLIGVLYFLLAGTSILGALGLTPLLTRAERVATAFLLGAGAVSGWILLCFVTGLGVTAVTVLLPILPIALLFRVASRRRHGTFPQPHAARGPLQRAAAGALIALVAGMVCLAAGQPMTGWDSRVQWARKAQVMLEEESVWSGELQDPATVHFHPRYPLLVPAAEAIAIRFGATRPETDLKVLFPLFWGAMLGVLSLFLRHTVNGAPYALLLFALVPYWWGYRFLTDRGAAFTGYPDLVLGAFMAASVVTLLLGLRRRDVRFTVLTALFLTFAGLSKAEGLAHVAVLAAVAAPWVWFATGRRFRWQAAACLAAPLVVLGIHQWLVVLPTPVGTLPDDYSTALGVDDFAGSLSRVIEVASSFARDLFLEPRHGFIGWLVVAALLLGAKRLRRPELGIPLGYTILMIGAFVVPYTVLPSDEWSSIYSWSSGRLFSQILPAAFLPIAVIAAGPAPEPSLAAPAAG